MDLQMVKDGPTPVMVDTDQAVVANYITGNRYLANDLYLE